MKSRDVIRVINALKMSTHFSLNEILHTVAMPLLLNSMSNYLINNKATIEINKKSTRSFSLRLINITIATAISCKLVHHHAQFSSC